jgi:hypothetical protein
MKAVYMLKMGCAVQQCVLSSYIYIYIYIYSALLSLLQWDINIFKTFKFVAAAFVFIIVAPFLKFNISTLCYDTWNIKSLEVHLSDFIYLYFNLYSCHLKVYIYFMYTFGFILKKVHQRHHSHAFQFPECDDKVFGAHA